MSNSDDPGWPFNVLELPEVTTDKKQIKRAYARKLKTIDQSEQMTEFQELRQAYESALVWEVWDDDDDDDPPIEPDTHDEPAPTEPASQEESGPAPESTPVLVLASEDPVQDEPETKKPAELKIEQPATEQLPETDWDKVFGLIEELFSNDTAPDWPKKLESTLNDAIFADPGAMEELENTIFNYLSEQIVYEEKDEDGFHFPAHITHEVVTLINEKFGWLTDYVYFQKRFWNAETVMVAMTNTTPVDQSFFTPNWKENPRQWFFESFLSFRLIWMSIVIGLFTNYIAQQTGLSKDGQVLDIAINFIVFIVIATFFLKLFRGLIEIILDALVALYRRFS